jgi:hypothetical protein
MLAESNVADTTLGTDAFGESVAISGSTIVVGDEDHNKRGYVYEFASAGLRWQLAGEQSGPNGFGITLAGSGPNLAIGTYSGRAYVYAQDGHGWHMTAALKSPAGDDESYFGTSVAISGATLAATAESKPSNAGQIFVFTDGPTGWTQAAKLGDPDTRRYSNFGASAISGNTMVVGDVYGASGQGRAYVYTDGPTGWAQTAELQGLKTTAGDQFGSDIGISGSTIVVGADDSEGLRGTAYVFAQTGSSWKQVTELNPSDTISNSDFGTSVAISGTTIVVGTDGTSSCSIRINGGPSRSIPCTPPWKAGAYVYAKTVSGWHLVTVLHRPNK